MTVLREKIIEKLFSGAALISAITTAAILLFLLVPIVPLLQQGDFLALMWQPWDPQAGQFGIYPMIVGTTIISSLALFFAFPLSLGCATLITVEEKSWLAHLLNKIVTLMTGIPTVIYGFVGIFLLVPLLRNSFDAGSGMCILAASLMLTLLVSPTMILIFRDSFASGPSSYNTAVLSLGGSKTQHFLYITLPHSWRGLIVGFSLALGRALGDTLIALMIAGNAIQVPGSLLDSARTLTTHIALVFAADYESPEFRAIFACAIFLYLFSSLLALIARLAHRQSKVNI